MLFVVLSGLFFPADEVKEDVDKDFLVGGSAFGDHQGHGDEGIVGDALAAIVAVEDVVLFEEPQEKRGGDTLVAIDERMVFDQEIEQVRGLGLDAGIDVAAVECLHDAVQGTGQAAVLFPSKELAGIEVRAQLPDEPPGFVIGDREGRGGGWFGYADSLMVVIIEKIKGPGVVGDYPQECGGFASLQVAPVGDGGDEADGLVQLLEPPPVDGAAL